LNFTSVDSHFHLWEIKRFHYSWMNGKETKLIEQDFKPEDLLPILDRHRILKAVLVQALDQDQEAPFLLDLADHYSFIAGVVVWLDMEDKNFKDHLIKYQSNPKFLGIRPMLQDIDDANWILKPSVFESFKILQKYDKSFDFLVTPELLPKAVQVVKQFPGLRFVIDHLSKPLIKSQQIEPWASYLKEIASYPNVYCKLSGLITEADHQTWRVEEIKPYVEIAVQAFGYDRLMFGSDWPVCLLAGNYDAVIQTLKECLGNIGPENEQKIFGKNAIKFYKIGPF
jgi:L-fuconolactonase